LSRTDTRWGVGPSGEIFILNKHDGMVRRIVGVVGFPDFPVADVLVNGSDGPITINEGKTLTVDLSFDAASEAGQPSEYYIVVDIPSHGVRYWFTQSRWVQQLWPAVPFYQGPMGNLGPATLISFNPQAAQWNWYLIVDNDQNNVINGTWWDAGAVTVAP
jgi:hypothetical protein